jgi:hypothetical protein
VLCGDFRYAGDLNLLRFEKPAGAAIAGVVGNVNE